MPTAYHVNGPAVVKIGVGAGALQVLGIAEDGVDIQFRRLIGEVKSDVAGPMAPAEIQDFGGDATITARVSVYDEDVLKSARKMSDATDDGQLPTIGGFIGGGSKSLKLVIASSLDSPFRFPTTVLRDAQDCKLGTKYTVWAMRFYAWAYIGPTLTTAKDVKLFDRTDG